MMDFEFCPVRSEKTLRLLLRAIQRQGSLLEPFADAIGRLSQRLAPLMPEGYFPDTYLDVDLQGREEPVLAFRLNAAECNLLMHRTHGSYFAQTNIPAVLAPEKWGRSVLVCHTAGEIHALEIADERIGVREALRGDTQQSSEHPAVAEILDKLAPFPVTCEVQDHDGECAVAIGLGPRSPKNRFSRKPFADDLLAILKEAGAPADQLARLKELSANFAIPHPEPDGSRMLWPASCDLSYLTLVFRDKEQPTLRVGIILTDKAIENRGDAESSGLHTAYFPSGNYEVGGSVGIKPVQAFQWHITDACDQRCKHCYLYAEDAHVRCTTTGWDMLMRTLDECEAEAARRHALPMLGISGGDPLLHPRFWDFAQEICRRGITWEILGNPFHLDAEACRRLRRLGVFQYQMSLDGLKAFHDQMRMPGSYEATLKAIELLNDAGIKTQLMATVSRLNLDDVIALMDVVADHGASSFTFARYCATSPKRAADYPTPEEYRRFLERYLDKSSELHAQGVRTEYYQKEHLLTLLRWERGEFKVPEWANAYPGAVCEGCHMGQLACILSNGDVMACRRTESVVGNVWEESLSDIMCGEKLSRYLGVREIEGCRDCELLYWCRGCRAVGINATGNLQAADPCCWRWSRDPGQRDARL